MSKKDHVEEELRFDEEVSTPELTEKAPDGSELDLGKKLAAAEAKAKESWELALRTRAEMENLQKRAVRDVENAHKYALEPFIKGLIPVVDSLEQGLSMPSEGNEHANALHHGMALTLKMFLNTLAKFSVEVVDPLHQPFDPVHHEAMVMQPSKDHPAGTVLTVVQKGYLLHGRLLRPARVVVAKAID
jgi:molecular chaperone GrpE